MDLRAVPTRGEHERQRLDVFPVEGSGAPVVLFVHGGGFVSGDKQVSPPFYSNVGRYFAAHDIVGACMNYRYAPAGGWPAAAHDVEAAVSWLLDRADLYGGNPQHLIVIGQSAGGCHVATWLFEPSLQGGKQDQISGAVLMSGFYEASRAARWRGTGSAKIRIVSATTFARPPSADTCLRTRAPR